MEGRKGKGKARRKGKGWREWVVRKGGSGWQGRRGVGRKGVEW